MAVSWGERKPYNLGWTGYQTKCFSMVFPDCNYEMFTGQKPISRYCRMFSSIITIITIDYDLYLFFSGKCCSYCQ